uniref:Uncharacterized protein n=1 Tax=Arundo donax TaxID=35708 RepID=A0A0A8Z1Q6_ARUDO
MLGLGARTSRAAVAPHQLW